MRLIRSRYVESSKWVLWCCVAAELSKDYGIRARRLCVRTISRPAARGAIFGHFVISSGKRRLVFSHFNCERSLNKNMPVACAGAPHFG
jgi:hypothetical protein